MVFGQNTIDCSYHEIRWELPWCLRPHKYLCRTKESLTDEILSLKKLPFNHVFHKYEVDDDTFISPSGCVKDLGVMINSKLDWEDHIFSLTKFGKRLTSWLLNVFFTRDKEVMLTLFNSIVRSKLEYCSPVWDPYKLKHINSIEQIQRSFTKKNKIYEGPWLLAKN